MSLQFWATLKFWELQKIIRLLSVLILLGDVKKIATQKIVTMFYVLLTQGYISCFCILRMSVTFTP